MTYATLDQLIARFGETMLVELADRTTPPAEEIDAAAEVVVNRALVDTDAEIDGHLAGIYALPIVGDAPPKLVDLALSIAIYKLHRWEVSDKIKDDYVQALKDLGQVSKGTIKLPIAGVEPAGKPGGGVMVTDRERPFTEANMKGFI